MAKTKEFKIRVEAFCGGCGSAIDINELQNGFKKMQIRVGSCQYCLYKAHDEGVEEGKSSK